MTGRISRICKVKPLRLLGQVPSTDLFRSLWLITFNRTYCRYQILVVGGASGLTSNVQGLLTHLCVHDTFIGVC